MIQKLDLPVTVQAVFDHKARKFSPSMVLFEGQEYTIVSTDYHHTYRDGRTLFHVFSVSSSTLFFRLVFNTEALFWTLTEISDGQSN